MTTMSARRTEHTVLASDHPPVREMVRLVQRELNEQSAFCLHQKG